MGKLRARWLVLVLGGILLAAAMLVGGAGNADAQGQSQGKGKAQGQEKGKSQGGDEAEGGGGQDNKVTLCHMPPGNPENAHVITVGAPAVKAHVAHGDKVIEDGAVSDGCGDSDRGTDPEECLAVGTPVEVEKGEGNVEKTV